MPSMGVNETRNAIVWPVRCASVVVRRTHIPLHQKCQRTCLCMPSVGVFEMRNTFFGLLGIYLLWHGTPNVHICAPKMTTKVSLHAGRECI